MESLFFEKQFRFKLMSGGMQEVFSSSVFCFSRRSTVIILRDIGGTLGLGCLSVTQLVDPSWYYKAPSSRLPACKTTSN